MNEIENKEKKMNEIEKDKNDEFFIFFESGED